jgi:hypothetical protein
VRWNAFAREKKASWLQDKGEPGLAMARISKSTIRKK